MKWLRRVFRIPDKVEPAAEDPNLADVQRRVNLVLREVDILKAIQEKQQQ